MVHRKRGGGGGYEELEKTASSLYSVPYDSHQIPLFLLEIDDAI